MKVLNIPGCTFTLQEGVTEWRYWWRKPSYACGIVHTQHRFPLGKTPRMPRTFNWDGKWQSWHWFTNTTLLREQWERTQLQQRQPIKRLSFQCKVEATLRNNWSCVKSQFAEDVFIFLLVWTFTDNNWSTPGHPSKSSFFMQKEVVVTSLYQKHSHTLHKFYVVYTSYLFVRKLPEKWTIPSSLI